MRIMMLGQMTAVRDEQVIERFVTRKNALLLAYLAYHRDKPHTRELLAELLWPESDPMLSRARLRQALASLRRQLESSELPCGTLINADRITVKLNSSLVDTDTQELQKYWEQSRQANTTEMAMECYRNILSLYKGEFLPRFDEEWIISAREHLAETAWKAALNLTEHCIETGKLEEACVYGRRLVELDSLSENSHISLIRAYLAAGNTDSALKQYHTLEQILHVHLGETPSMSAKALLKEISDNAGQKIVYHASFTQRSKTSDQIIPTTFEGTRHASPARNSISQPSIPLQLTRFFGRNEEILRIQSLLSNDNKTRLVTIIGLGGIGKTRLAIESANRIQNETSISACFAPLVEIRDPSLIPSAIAAALKLTLRSDQQILSQVIKALNAQQTLLLLDNMEQLYVDESSLTSCIHLINLLLQEVPALRCIITSRQAIGLIGEQRINLQPLRTPSQKESLIIEEIMTYDSAQLFLDRAQAVRESMRFTLSNVQAAVSLLNFLEGIPLSIELAATWVQHLSPAQMLQKFSKRFDLLKSLHPGESAKHARLLACIEWSFSLLTAKQRNTFVSLSLFRGGWSLENAASLIDEECEETETLLIELSERCLINIVCNDEVARYSMLESLREYAIGILSEKERKRLGNRDSELFLKLIKEMHPILNSSSRNHAIQQLKDNQENLLSALEWSLQYEQETALEIGALLWPYWLYIGNATEGRRYLERILSLNIDIGIGIKSKLLEGVGALAQSQADYQVARSAYAQNLQLGRDLAQQDLAAIALNNLGSLYYEQGRLESSESVYEEALAIWRMLGAQNHIARTLNNLALVAHENDELDRAAILLNDSLQIKRRLNDSPGTAAALNNLGLIEMERGDYSTARAIYEEALIHNRNGGNEGFKAILLSNMANAISMYGEPEIAAQLLEESLKIRVDHGDRRGIAYALEAGALLTVTCGRAESAARLLGAASSLRMQLEAPPLPKDRKRLEHIVEELEKIISPKLYTALYTLGQSLNLEQAIEYAKEQISLIKNRS